MAREGLRTLVIARRPLSEDTYAAFANHYAQARLSHDRHVATQHVISQFLEMPSSTTTTFPSSSTSFPSTTTTSTTITTTTIPFTTTTIIGSSTSSSSPIGSLELLAVTGVEDKLQDGVRSTLEVLRRAGVATWMLTGDKVETGMNIAVASKMIGRSQPVRVIQNGTRREEWTTWVGEGKWPRGQCEYVMNV